MTWIMGATLALIVTLISLRLHLLTPAGSVAAFFLGWIVYGLGELTFSIPLVAFFVFSSLFSKINNENKRVPSKKGARDHIQVLANGLLPAIMLICWSFFGDQMFVWLFVVAVAAATADTWATEIGMLSRKPPRSLLTFAQVDAGSSGGITLLGTFAAACGSAFIVLLSALLLRESDFATDQLPIFLLIGIGFASHLVDSFLGAKYQARYRCSDCGSVTERRRCHRDRVVQISGFSWMTNDAVNFFSVLFSLVPTGFLFRHAQ